MRNKIDSDTTFQSFPLIKYGNSSWKVAIFRKWSSKSFQRYLTWAKRRLKQLDSKDKKENFKKKDKSYEIHKNWVVVLSSNSNFTIIMKIGSKKLVFSWSRSNYIQSVTNDIPRSCLDWMLWSTQDWQKSPCKTHFVWTNQLPRQVIFGTVQKRTQTQNWVLWKITCERFQITLRTRKIEIVKTSNQISKFNASKLENKVEWDFRKC